MTFQHFIDRLLAGLPFMLVYLDDFLVASGQVASVFDQALYGIFASICYFQHRLECLNFTVWTNHKPLTFALSRVSDSWTARQQHQFSYVEEFTNKIIHVPVRLNVVANLMSRPPQAVPAPWPAMAASVKVPSGSLAVPR